MTLDPRKSALYPLPPDSRDFSHHALYGTLAASDLPTQDFMTAVPLEIKDQDTPPPPTDYCTAYAASAVAEDEDQVVFCPEWLFKRSKDILAASGAGVGVYSDMGLNLRDIGNGGVQAGFLPRTYDPYACNTPARPPRQVIISPNPWPNEPALDEAAAPYKKLSYVAVDGPYDTFDNIRSFLWMHAGDRESVFVGIVWRESWITAPNGIIPTAYEADGSPHAFKICGQKTINGTIYLVAQMSDGVQFGDKGFCYFPRETVDKEIGPAPLYGIFAFVPVEKDAALWHLNNGVKITDPWIVKCWKVLSSYIGLS